MLNSISSTEGVRGIPNSECYSAILACREKNNADNKQKQVCASISGQSFMDIKPIWGISACLKLIPEEMK